MTPEIEELHRNPPDQDRVCLEIGRTILAVQPTESAFNAITLIVIPDRPFTVEGVAGFDPKKKSKTLGQLQKHLVEKLKANLDAGFLSALEKFIDDRNLLVHRADSIPGWKLKTPGGRIAAFLFLKNLQLTNILLLRILVQLTSPRLGRCLAAFSATKLMAATTAVRPYSLISATIFRGSSSSLSFIKPG